MCRQTKTLKYAEIVMFLNSVLKKSTVMHSKESKSDEHISIFKNSNYND